jgi:1,2-diacylglycerol 3-beta-galactosyltransferase
MRALLDGRSPAQFVAITGRNGRLRERLQAATWPQPLRVMGFVDNVDEWMAAADLLVTKAGPGTIAEALVVRVPMVLCGAVPGQEPANVRYAVESGAARWAPRPEDAAEAVHELLSDDGVLKQMSERARTAGNPHAAQQAAAFVWGEIRGRTGSGP